MAVLKNQVPPTPKPSPYGNGGVNYNTADTEMKKKLAQSQIKINQNPSYVQNETSRALQVIKNREAQGMDTSAQQKYLTQNLGYKTPQTTTTGTVTSSYTPTTTIPQQTTQQNSTISQLLSSMMEKTNQPTKEFSYSIESDPAYQAALARARSNIDAGNAQAQAEMNRRGILNSTITSDRMGEISSKEMGRVESEVVPQLMQQAFQRYMNEQQQEQQRFANMGALAQMYASEDQRGFDKNVTEANLTGNYTSPEVKAYVQQILGLKQQAESKGVTAQQRAELSSQADGLRAQLQALGVDPSQLAASVNYNAASKANPGVRTLGGQQMDFQRQQANNDAALAWSQMSGQILGPQADYAGYLRQIQSGNNPLTVQGQQLSLQQQEQKNNMLQQVWNNAWAEAETLGYVTDKLANLTGFKVGTPTLQARQLMENMQLNQDRMQLDRDRMGMDQYQFDQQQGLREAQFGFDMANAGNTGAKPNYTVNPKSVSDMIISRFGLQDVTEVPENMKGQIFEAIRTANMSPEDKNYTAKLFGINSEDYGKK